MKIESALKIFIEKAGKGPFLLGLSGGPDSMSLFHFFINMDIKFEVAHINHNWRPESVKEYENIKKLCQKFNIFFHGKELFPEQLKGNLEDACRRERLHFFKEIIVLKNLKALVLGHHGDDLAETVLKRILEGASLSRLKGISYCSEYDSMTIFRPLLFVYKKDIVKWLDLHHIPYFIDHTNFDTKYLRSRMRKELFPQISLYFGKEITPSLLRLSQSSEELNDFLEDFLQNFRHKVIREKERIIFDLSHEKIEKPFAWKILVKDFLNREGLSLSTASLEMIIFLLQQGKGRKNLFISGKKISIYKKTLSISDPQV